MLVDGDPNHSASLVWYSARQQFLGNKLDPERLAVVSVAESPRYARTHEHLIFDTKARPDPEELQGLALGCDFIILPTTPEPFALHSLMQTAEALYRIGGRYRVLLSIVAPYPNQDGARARAALEEAGIPEFRVSIPRRVEYQRVLLSGTTVNSAQYDLVCEEICDEIALKPAAIGTGKKGDRLVST